MAKEKKLPALPALPLGVNEAFIPYSAWRAQGRFRYKLLQESSIREQIIRAVGIMVAVYAVIFTATRFLPAFVLGLPVSMFINLIIYSALFVFSFPLITSPSNIQIGKEGLRVHWLSFLGLLSSPWIDHSYIDFVNVSNYRRGYYKSKAIDIYINKDRVPLSLRRALRLIAPTLWCVSLGTKPTLKLRLDIAAISHEADLQVLLRAFKDLLPAEKLGTELLELEEHGGSSFTKLWLDSLDGGSRSRRIGDSSSDLALQPLEPGETVLDGQYEIVRRLAAGGQAVTYLALAKGVQPEVPLEVPLEVETEARSETQSEVQTESQNNPKNDVQVVLKEFVLPIRGGIDIRKRALENVEHEGKLLEKLKNERIVKLLDCFVDSQRAYLVLEYIDGKSLRSLVQDDGVVNQLEAIRLAIEMCSVLSYLHTLEPAIVHRDFTPENLLLRSTGELALIDFNVAEQLESKETKTMVGKHCYVSPEQFRGKATTQSDIYSCGCTLFWLLTGADPEPISMSQPQILRPEITSDLNDIVARATAIDVSKRFASALAMKTELEKLV
ncbi:hypothetical protein BH11CYA1_BH11CYA1_38660 [soil metagenome]